MSTAQRMTNEELMASVSERIWHERDLDAIDEHYAEDFVFHDPQGESHDRESYRAWIDTTLTAFPDFHFEIHQLIGDGDWVAGRFTFGGTWEGEFMGMDPNGKSFEVDGMGMARFEDGKIVESWMNTNGIGMRTQLGMIPTESH